MLTYLRLSKIQISTLPEMPLLQQLCLSSFSNDMRCQTLRKILCQTPNVSTLTLEHPFDPSLRKDVFPEDVPDISSEPLFDLPHLRTLRLVGCVLHIPPIMQLFPTPYAEMDFEVELHEDQTIDYSDDDVFLDHVSKVTPQVQTRIARYLSLICKGDFELICWVGLVEYSEGSQKFVKVQFSKPSHEEVLQRSLNLRLLCNSHNNISNILQWATVIHLHNYDVLSPFVTSSEIVQTPHLKCLTVSNLHVSSEDPSGGDKESIGQLLSDRFLVRGSPIDRFELKYYDRDQEDYREPPTWEERISVECRLKRPGWVHTLEWVDNCKQDEEA
jgi:hypothetical protein